MKLLTKEEEREHYKATLQGGIGGTVIGAAVGVAGVSLASRRYRFVHDLTLPMKAFLVTSSGTFAGIISADHFSRRYEAQRNPKQREYEERRERDREAEVAGKTFTERGIEFARKERYKIVAGSWVASMFAAFAIVNRNKYLNGPQKLVQARVYAQFLTLGVLVASAAFEIADSRNQEGRWETVRYVDPTDPEHKRMIEKKVEREGGSGYGGEKEDPENRDLWKKMVQEEEERLREVEEERAQWKKDHEKTHSSGTGNGNGKGKGKKEGKDGEKKNEKESEKKKDEKDTGDSEQDKQGEKRKEEKEKK